MIVLANRLKGQVGSLSRNKRRTVVSLELCARTVDDDALAFKKARIVNRLVAKQSSSDRPVIDRRPTVAVDFDGRIVEWQPDDKLDLTSARLREGTKRALSKFRQAGISVLIWTSRPDTEEVGLFLKQSGVPFDTVNSNPDFEPGSRKMFADVYLDDRGEGDPDATWDELTDLVFSRIFGKARQPVDSWEELEELAGRAQPELEKLLSTVAPDAKTINLSDDLLLGELEAKLLQPGPVVVLPPVKLLKRAKEKVESDYDGSWDKLFDVNRAALAFDTKQELDDAAERLRGTGPLARPPKDRFTEPLSNGYRDLLLNPRLPCGMICEVQLHLKPMLMAREREKLSYDVVRAIYASLEQEGREELTPAEAEAVRRARKTAKHIYARAWAECTAGEEQTTQKSLQPVNRLKSSYFETCDRDDKGRCKPSGEGGGADPARSPGGSDKDSGSVDDLIAGVKNPSGRKLAKEAYELAMAAGDKLPPVVSWPLKGKTMAMYSPSNDKVYLSTKINSKSQSMLDKQVEIGWLSQSNPVLHELGHKVHSEAVGQMFDSAKNHPFSEDQKQAIASKVSKYAATNGLEFVAEVYAGTRSGKKYDEEIQRIFDAVTLGRVKL